MAGKQVYTAEQVCKALEEARGGKFLAAERLGCTEETIRNYEKRYTSVRQVATKYKGRRVDVAELKLDAAVLNAEPWAIKYVLSTLGKDRGYVERQEVTGKDGEGILIRVEYADVEIDTAAPTFSAKDSD